MTLPVQDLARLRASVALLESAGSVAQLRASLGYHAADQLLGGGIVCGALHEVFAAGAGMEVAASGFALALACCASRPARVLLWVRQDYSALESGEMSATGLLELGCDPDRVLLVRVADSPGLLRAAAEGLACASLGALVLEFNGESRMFDLTTSRRLALAAARHGVTAIFLRHGAEADASAAETRWRVGPASSNAAAEDWGMPIFDAQLLRNRHGGTGRWIMEWNADEGCFRDGREAHPRIVAAAAADRKAEAADFIQRRTG